MQQLHKIEEKCDEYTRLDVYTKFLELCED